MRPRDLEEYVRGIYEPLIRDTVTLDVSVHIHAGMVVVKVTTSPDDRGIVLGKRGGIIDGVRLLVRGWCKKHLGMESEVKVL